MGKVLSLALLINTKGGPNVIRLRYDVFYIFVKTTCG